MRLIWTNVCFWSKTDTPGPDTGFKIMLSYYSSVTSGATKQQRWASAATWTLLFLVLLDFQTVGHKQDLEMLGPCWSTQRTQEYLQSRTQMEGIVLKVQKFKKTTKTVYYCVILHIIVNFQSLIASPVILNVWTRFMAERIVKLWKPFYKTLAERSCYFC